MAKLFREFLRHTLYRGKGNLYTLDDPYRTISKVLDTQSITGIIDAGASDGRVSERFARRFPQARFYQFEPNPIYREALEQQSQQDSRYHPYHVALSNEPGELELQNTQSPGNVSFFKPNDMMLRRYAEGSKIQNTIKVPVTTLDQWWQENGKPDVQLMKFDIQGSEARALAGATQLLDSGVLAIYSEVYFNAMYEGGALFGDIDKVLRDRGFVLYNFYSARHDPTGSGMLLWGHGLFVHAQRLNIH